MTNFDLKSYLTEGKMLKENINTNKLDTWYNAWTQALIDGSDEDVEILDIEFQNFSKEEREYLDSKETDPEYQDYLNNK
jgi:hypothetical protein